MVKERGPIHIFLNKILRTESRAEKKERKENEQAFKTANLLIAAYRLDQLHLNTGWTVDELTSRINAQRLETGEKPLKPLSIQLMLADLKYDGKLISHRDKRVGGPSQYKLSPLGTELVEEAIEFYQHLQTQSNLHTPEA